MASSGTATGPGARVQVYELTEWGRELEPVVLQLGLWGERAPIPEGAPPSLDSLLLAIQAKADPGTVQGVYELHIGADTITVRAVAGAVRIRHGTAEQPAAILSTDGDTLRAVCFGQRSHEDAVKSGDLTLDGTDSGHHRPSQNCCSPSHPADLTCPAYREQPGNTKPSDYGIPADLGVSTLVHDRHS